MTAKNTPAQPEPIANWIFTAILSSLVTSSSVGATIYAYSGTAEPVPAVAAFALPDVPAEPEPAPVEPAGDPLHLFVCSVREAAILFPECQGENAWTNRSEKRLVN